MSAGRAVPAERAGSADRAVFVSDLHIRHFDDEPGRQFRAFLAGLDADVDVVVVGDLFDWFYGLPGAVPEHLLPVVDALRARRRVLWIEGNHDMRVGRAIGPGSVEVREGPVTLHVGRLSLDVQHGDLVDPSARAYRMLRGFLRSPIVGGVTRLLGARATQRLGEGATWARHKTDHPLGVDGRKAPWLAAARAQAKGIDGVDLAVRGHGHWLGWWEEGLVCLGDWLHYRSYLEVDGDGARLRRFEPDGADPVLAVGPVGALPW